MRRNDQLEIKESEAKEEKRDGKRRLQRLDWVLTSRVDEKKIHVLFDSLLLHPVNERREVSEIARVVRLGLRVLLVPNQPAGMGSKGDPNQRGPPKVWK